MLGLVALEICRFALACVNQSLVRVSVVCMCLTRERTIQKVKLIYADLSKIKLVTPW